MQQTRCDILILGSGGAGLLAAIRAFDRNPDLKIVMATKGLAGKSGCTRMVQGGFNAVLNENDSVESHFRDTIKGGAFLNDQELAWQLVRDAPDRIMELETRAGVFFDRDERGRIHQKPFAGQSFDRTVHRGDLTGIELIARLRDQLFARDVVVLEETRAVDLLTVDGRVVGALLLVIGSGEFLAVNARATLLCTGGGAAVYKVSAPSLEKTGDGVGIAYRAGAEFTDMEMLQFHPTGLLAGGSLITGSVLEEGLRGAGGYLLNALGERYMERYDPQLKERSTRDVVSRAGYLEIMAGRGTPQGGVWIDVSHLGHDFVCRAFPGMRERVLTVGRDLAKEKVEVSPTAHFHMGGIKIDLDCRTNLEGLFAAGEDAGGVHGANRLGGNGVCESIVYGARAGDALAAWVAGRPLVPFSTFQVQAAIDRTTRCWSGAGERPVVLRHELRRLLWEKAGVVRSGASLRAGLQQIEELKERARSVRVEGPRTYNLSWQDALNAENMLAVAESLVRSALLRTECRGSHWRTDCPETDDRNWLKNIYARRGDDGEMLLETRPVRMSRMTPDELTGLEAQALGAKEGALR